VTEGAVDDGDDIEFVPFERMCITLPLTGRKALGDLSARTSSGVEMSSSSSRPSTNVGPSSLSPRASSGIGPSSSSLRTGWGNELWCDCDDPGWLGDVLVL
jgi:hypothetical protein